MCDAIFPTFAFKVRDLNRMGLSVAAIARSMGVDEAAVLDAHRMLYLPVNDSDLGRSGVTCMAFSDH